MQKRFSENRFRARARESAFRSCPQRSAGGPSPWPVFLTSQNQSSWYCNGFSGKIQVLICEKNVNLQFFYPAKFIMLSVTFPFPANAGSAAFCLPTAQAEKAVGVSPQGRFSCLEHGTFPGYFHFPSPPASRWPPSEKTPPRSSFLSASRRRFIAVMSLPSQCDG